MNKAKFKIDTLIETKSGETHKVNGVLARADGFYYENANGAFVPESDVLHAYRPVSTAGRKPRLKKVGTEKTVGKGKKQFQETAISRAS